MTDFSDVRIFLCTIPTNMNYSFDRLMGRAQEVFEQDPTSGHLFLFWNKGRDRMKILFWDRDGFCIWYKKLETEYTQIFGFPEIRRAAYNRRLSPAEIGRMVGISRNSGQSRRRNPMPRQGSLPAPPRALWQRESFRSTNSGRS